MLSYNYFKFSSLNKLLKKTHHNKQQQKLLHSQKIIQKELAL
jgi:hypothetical protein